MFKLLREKFINTFSKKEKAEYVEEGLYYSTNDLIAALNNSANPVTNEAQMRAIRTVYKQRLVKIEQWCESHAKLPDELLYSVNIPIPTMHFGFEPYTERNAYALASMIGFLKQTKLKKPVDPKKPFGEKLMFISDSNLLLDDFIDYNESNGSLLALALLAKQLIDLMDSEVMSLQASRLWHSGILVFAIAYLTLLDTIEANLIQQEGSL